MKGYNLVKICTYKTILAIIMSRHVLIKPTTGNKTIILLLGVIVFISLYLQRDTPKHTQALKHKGLAFLSPHRGH